METNGHVDNKLIQSIIELFESEALRSPVNQAIVTCLLELLHRRAVERELERKDG
jgi:hypothetical protein